MSVTIAHIQEDLQKQFSKAITAWDEAFGMPCVTVAPDQTLAVAQYLFEKHGFQFLTDVTGVHYPDRTGEELCSVIHIHNLVDNIRLKIKAYMPIANPFTKSLTPLFKGANWMERETFDFYGIQYEGHPDLRRILNADEMDYHPMRKEYPMEDPTRLDKDDDMFGRGGTL